MFMKQKLEQWFFVLCLMLFAFMAMIGNAHAEVPASVTASITEAVTDVATIGAAVLGVIIGIYVFKWLRRTF